MKFTRVPIILLLWIQSSIAQDSVSTFFSGVVSNGEPANFYNVQQCRLFTDINLQIDQFGNQLYAGLSEMLAGVSALFADFTNVPSNSTVAVVGGVVNRQFNITKSLLHKAEGLANLFGINVTQIINQVSTVFPKKMQEMEFNIVKAAGLAVAKIVETNAELELPFKNPEYIANSAYCRAHILPGWLFGSQVHTADYKSNCIAQYNATVGVAIQEVQSSVAVITKAINYVVNGLDSFPSNISPIIKMATNFLPTFFQNQIEDLEAKVNATINKFDSAVVIQNLCTNRVIENIEQHANSLKQATHDCLTNWI